MNKRIQLTPEENGTGGWYTILNDGSNDNYIRHLDKKKKEPLSDIASFILVEAGINCYIGMPHLTNNLKYREKHIKDFSNDESSSVVASYLEVDKCAVGSYSVDPDNKGMRVFLVPGESTFHIELDQRGLCTTSLK